MTWVSASRAVDSCACLLGMCLSQGHTGYLCTAHRVLHAAVMAAAAAAAGLARQHENTTIYTSASRSMLT